MKKKTPVKNVAAFNHFDLWYLARGFAFDGRAVSESIRSTFERRAKQIPPIAPVGFTEAFWSDPSRQAMWEGFCKKSVRVRPFPTLEEVVTFVAAFIVPPAIAARKDGSFDQHWAPGGPWKSDS